MSHVIVITSRKLLGSEQQFLQQAAAISAAGPLGIILREKDLDNSEYLDLAKKVLHAAENHGSRLIIHGHPEAAAELGLTALHMPLDELRRMSSSERSEFRTLGASCHSVDDVKEAENLGCTYVTAGHVYATDCKKGLAPRGLDFLRTTCSASDIPVYALGGLTPERMNEVMKAGAAGAAVMSSAMKAENPSELFEDFERAAENFERNRAD